jgi:hypothetical protein
VDGDGNLDILIGAPATSGSTPRDGAAYIHLGGWTGTFTESLSAADSRLVSTPGSSAEVGSSVASAGDVNDDGYSDLLVGAKGDTAGAGAAYLIYGGW